MDIVDYYWTGSLTLRESRITLIHISTVCHNPSRNSTLSSSSISRDSQLKVSSKWPINFSPTVSTETSSPFTIWAKDVTPAPWWFCHVNLVSKPIIPECHREQCDQTRTYLLYNWGQDHGLLPDHCCAPSNQCVKRFFHELLLIVVSSPQGHRSCSFDEALWFWPRPQCEGIWSHAGCRRRRAGQSQPAPGSQHT